MRLKVSSAKRRPFCLGLNVLMANHSRPRHTSIIPVYVVHEEVQHLRHYSWSRSKRFTLSIQACDDALSRCDDVNSPCSPLDEKCAPKPRRINQFTSWVSFPYEYVAYLYFISFLLTALTQVLWINPVSWKIGPESSGKYRFHPTMSIKLPMVLMTWRRNSRNQVPFTVLVSVDSNVSVSAPWAGIILARGGHPFSEVGW